MRFSSALGSRTMRAQTRSRTHIFKHTGASDCGSDGPCGRRRAWARSRVRHARDEPIKQAAIRTHTQTVMRTLALLQPIFCDVVRQYRAVLRLAVRLDVVCCLLQAKPTYHVSSRSQVRIDVCAARHPSRYFSTQIESANIAACARCRQRVSL